MLPRTGTSNSSRPTARMSASCSMPIRIYGTTLPIMSSAELTGVLMSNSRLPRSRSRTIATAVNRIMVIVRITPISPGTMLTGVRRSGL